MPSPAPVEIAFRPMRSRWNGPSPLPKPQAKRWGKIELDVSKILVKLAWELGQLGVRDAMVETDHAPGDYAIFGRPRAESRPKSGKIQVWFQLGGKNKCLPACAWGTWEENLKAVALTLERQRQVRDYGVVSIEHQMAAFEALPASKGEGECPTKWDTVEAAMRWLCKVGDGQLLSEDPADLDRVYRDAARKAHPDKPGGSAKLMSSVAAAKAFIETHSTPAGART